ncbi:MAG: HEAT repeat domain-containing protein, partial [Candidatus Heimdallarchaeota archaeon]
KIDFHLIIDLLSLAHIIGQSISLSTSLIENFTKVNLEPFDDHINDHIDKLLQSPIAEERRIGLLMVGYLNRYEFFEEVEKMSNYDILFEDAYYALGLMTNPNVVELLGTKFMHLNKNHIQRSAIAKILSQKGNPLAALWLYRSNEFDFTTSYTKSIFLSRELILAGIKPAIYLTSNDDFIQPITMKLVEIVSTIFTYAIELIAEIELEKTVKTLLNMLEAELSLDVVKTLYSIKTNLEEIYELYDPYSVKSDIRKNIVNSWNLLKEFPNEEVIEYLSTYAKGNLIPKSEDFLFSLRLIRNFNLKEFEPALLEVAATETLSLEEKFEMVSCLGQIGGEISLEYIIKVLKEEVDLKKRTFTGYSTTDFTSEIEFIDDFDNELIIGINRTFELDILKWFNTDFHEIFYNNALFAIGKIKSEKAIPILLEALEDYDPKIRYQAIYGLKEQGILTEIIEEKLISLAKFDNYMSVQREAINALGVLNSKEAVSIFTKTIFTAIEEGVLELAGEIDQSYDNRWVSTDETFTESEQGLKEIGMTAKMSEGIAEADKKQEDNDISRWIKRMSYNSSKELELREDIDELDELSEDFDYIDDREVSSIYEDADIFPEDKELKDQDEDWLSELGEQFKQLSLVDSSLEALKTTKAVLPINELKELIEHPVDEELYKDALIILAKNNNSFAMNELIGLFDIVDYTRAREITNVILELNDELISVIKKEAKHTIDWILSEMLTRNENSN